MVEDLYENKGIAKLHADALRWRNEHGRLVLLTVSDWEHGAVIVCALIPVTVDLGVELSAFEAEVDYRPPLLGELPMSEWDAEHGRLQAAVGKLVGLGLLESVWLERSADKNELVLAFARWLTRRYDKVKILHHEYFGYTDVPPEGEGDAGG